MKFSRPWGGEIGCPSGGPSTMVWPGVLSQGNFDVLWVHGYNRWFHWLAMAWAKIRGLKVLVRDEATLLSVPRS